MNFRRSDLMIYLFKDNPQHYFYMIVKFIIFGALITTLNMSEVTI